MKIVSKTVIGNGDFSGYPLFGEGEVFVVDVTPFKTCNCSIVPFQEFPLWY